MLSNGFSRALTESGFRHRATILPGGRVVYKLADGSGHVGLPLGEWQALGDAFADAARPVGRTTRRLSIGLYPGIFLFGMTLGQVVPGAGIAIVAGIFLGPLAIYLWQSYRIRAIARGIEAVLVQKPRVAAVPAAPSRPPRWLEIAFMVLVGPGLIVQVYGSFYPDAFRNTPWTGMHLDWTGVAGIAVLAAILLYRWRGHRQDVRAQAVVEQGARQRYPGRRTSVVARARGEAG